jgi:preprotein translocase subunit SecA
MAFLDDEVGALVGQHLSAAVGPDAPGMEALANELRRMGFAAEEATEDALWELGGAEGIGEHFRALAETMLEARETEIGAEGWALVERIVLLRTIDSLWVEHLTEIDDMRRGIGLRGYAQQDPLNEFRKEAFRLYEELRGLIRHQVASQIFRVSITRQPAPAPGVAAQPGPGGQARVAATAGAGTRAAAAQGGGTITSAGPAGLLARAAGSSASGLGAGGAQTARPGHTPTGAKIGRNDPCWCGSGQKYKRCHGR